MLAEELVKHEAATALKDVFQLSSEGPIMPEVMVKAVGCAPT